MKKLPYLIGSFLLVFVLAISISVFPESVFAAAAGPNTCGTSADNSSVGTGAWSDATLGCSGGTLPNDANQIVAGIATQTHYLVLSNFGFAIPAGATINGISVTIAKLASSAILKDNSVEIVKGGVIGPTNLSTGAVWPTGSFASVSYGSSATLWGNTWSSSDINSSSFGVAISAVNTSGTVRGEINSATVTITYTPGSGGSPVSVTSNITFFGF